MHDDQRPLSAFDRSAAGTGRAGASGSPPLPYCCPYPCPYCTSPPSLCWACGVGCGRVDLWAQPVSWTAKASRRAPRTARASRCRRTAARQRPPGRSPAASGASGAGFRRFRRRPRPPQLRRQLQHALALLRLLSRRAVGCPARRGARTHPRRRLARNLRGVPSAPPGSGGRAGPRAPSDVVPKSAAPRGRGTSPLFVRTACALRAQRGGAAGAARHTLCPNAGRLERDVST